MTTSSTGRSPTLFSSKPCDETWAGHPGYLGSTRYEVLENPDIVVEIADWESAEVRAAAMQEAMASGAYLPLGELLAAPFRVTVISELL